MLELKETQKEQYTDFLQGIHLQEELNLNLKIIADELSSAKQLTTLETGAQLLIVAFKTAKTKYGDTFIICTKNKKEYKSYWSTAQLTSRLSKIVQDGRTKLDIYKTKYTIY